MACGGLVSAHGQRAPAAARGGSLVVGLSGEPDSLDPAHSLSDFAFDVFSNIYDTLVVQTGTHSYAGEIAKSWTITPNGLTYTFTIRKGLVFSNGDPLNAQAVAFTLNRILNPATKSPAVGLLGPIKTVKAPNATTVVITLSHAYAYELGNLAVQWTGIEDPLAVEKEGSAYGRHPVGSGPFMLKSWISGESITLIPNPHFHSYAPYDKNHGEAYLRSLKFDFITNSETLVAALQTGEVQYIPGVPGQDLALLRSKPTLRSTETPGADDNYLEFRTQVVNGKTTIAPPFNSLAVRQAVGYAIDRPGIVTSALFGLGKPLYGFIPPGEDAYDPGLSADAYPYNPTKAESLLSKAGWLPGAGGVREKDGKQLVIHLWAFGQDPYPEAATLIQNELDSVGFKCTVTTLELSTFEAEYPKGDASLDIIGLGWPNSSIMNIALTLQFGTGNYPDPVLLGLLDHAVTVSNFTRRVALYDEAQKYSLAHAYALPLWTDETANVYQDTVHGLVFTPSNSVDYVDTYVN
jgi:peptide/nickel transport system substrate-binding protein